MQQTDIFHNLIEYSVSEISGAVKRVVEDNFGRIRVRGELSEAKVHTSGHLYLTLKDEKSSLKGVCWKGNVSKLKFKPQNGLEVVCTGKISTYAGSGKSEYQMVIDSIEPYGAGALMALFEELKKKLFAEGLFEQSRKKAIPYLPKVIGVVTSPTGAVIRDILHRVRDRFPCHVIVWGAAVQGEGAAEQIAAGINGLNNLPVDFPKPDLIIVARGGGSVEDLWCFNEEVVVRAVANSQIPLISAVGHETDTTLIDFVSDLRAPTPTAAAEHALPVLQDLIFTLSDMNSRLARAEIRLLSEKSMQVESLSRMLPKPEQILETAMQKVDDWSERLLKSLPNLIDTRTKQLKILEAGIKPNYIAKQIEFSTQKTSDIARNMNNAILRNIDNCDKKLEAIGRLLESLHYKRVLERGFAIVRDDNSKIISTITDAKSSKTLQIEFRDGVIRTST